MATSILNLRAATLFDALRWRNPVGRGHRAGPPAPRATGNRAVSLRRAEAMRALFPKLSIWLAREAALSEMQEAYRCLEQAVDPEDLERRIRELQRSDSPVRWT